jgi:hypothetical protein
MRERQLEELRRRTRKNKMLMEWRFPMTMTIRCYDCGTVFDVVLAGKDSRDCPCPACGRVEVIDLGAWEKKAIAWNAKMTRKFGGGRYP